jgi:hypothetical protein
MNLDVRRLIVICFVLCAIISGSALGSDEINVEVRRLDGDYAGWWVAESANFRVYHQEDSDLARKTARTAERARVAAYRKWFGKPAAAWQPRCDIFLHGSDSDYYQGLGLAAAPPGYSTIQMDAGRMVTLRIDLQRDNADLLVAILPHEVTHIVLWSWFGQEGFPQWINEGMAVLTEPRERVERHLRNLPRHRRQGELVPIPRLVQSRDYPERRLLGPFYAQSVSLVEFLAGVKGAATFTKFVRDGMRGDYETASRRHYGWTLEQMEERWWRHAFASKSR